MSTPRVYLAGQITGLSYKEANGWRSKATELLDDMVCLNPLSTKSALVGVEEIQANESQRLSMTAEDIMDEDLDGVEIADVVLAKFCVGFGTPFELGFAYHTGIPIVIWLPEEFKAYREHPFMRCAEFVEPTLELATARVRTLAFYKE